MGFDSLVQLQLTVISINAFMIPIKLFTLSKWKKITQNPISFKPELTSKTNC